MIDTLATPGALAAYRSRHRIDPKQTRPDRTTCAVDEIRIHRRKGGWIHDSIEIRELVNEAAGWLWPGEEIPDTTARKNGTPKIGDRCPWCGMIIEGPDHSRSHD